MNQRRGMILVAIILFLTILIIGGAFVFSRLQQKRAEEALPDESVVVESPATAAASGEAVVYGVLLYSPNCPHCHQVITEDWPQFREEFGSQFELLFIDVTSSSGQPLAADIYDYYGVPEDSRVVPMMMIGDSIFIGGDQIPNQGREAVRAGIAAGGVPFPNIPSLIDAYNQAIQMME